jgi:hypothetical protein
MEHLFDEFSKSFAESVPRRESLRRLGAVFAGALLAPVGISTTWARAPVNPCKAFCDKCPKKKQSQCLAACQACGGNTNRLCGSCGNYACCANGSACCDGYCTDFDSDESNCGGCGYACDQMGPNEEGVCVNGDCHYQCVTGTTRCNGICISVSSDPNNCGACGQVCPASAPFCNQGVCTTTGCPGGLTMCGGVCTNTAFDTLNCGGCGVVCAAGETCSGGVCQSPF